MKLTLVDVPGLVGIALVVAGAAVFSLAAGLVAGGFALVLVSWLLSGRDS